MMDWLAKCLNLPDYYLNEKIEKSSNNIITSGNGGGVIQGATSETTFLVLLAARNKTVNEIKKKQPNLPEYIIQSKLIMYTSELVIISYFNFFLWVLIKILI